jgi:hypothetical protein
LKAHARSSPFLRPAWHIQDIYRISRVLMPKIQYLTCGHMRSWWEMAQKSPSKPTEIDERPEIHGTWHAVIIQPFEGVVKIRECFTLAFTEAVCKLDNLAGRI